MANNLNYRYEGDMPVSVTFDTAANIDIGDMVWIDAADSYNLKSAADFTYGASLAATQRLFARSFAGVAGQSFDGTNTDRYGIKDGKIRVDVQGVFEFACASASFKVGDLVGVDDNGDSDALLPQQVIAVASEDLAIGRAVEETSSATTVKVRIFPAKTGLLHPAVTMSVDGDITLTAGDDVTIKSGVANSDIVALQVYDYDAPGYKSMVLLTSGATPSVQIGTAAADLVGFYNATAVAQPASADQGAVTAGIGTAANTTLVAVTNTAATDQSGTINDNFEKVTELVNSIRSALVTLGLIKGAA